jgi:NitT/TauT family transport system ATP-binding protein
MNQMRLPARKARLATDVAEQSRSLVPDSLAPGTALVVADEVVREFSTRSGAAVRIGPLSFELAAGEFVAIVGASGCGKTTLLRLIAGLLPATGGTMMVRGEHVTEPVANAGVVFQQPTLLDWMSTLRNVTLQLDVRHEGNRSERDARGRALLTSVGLAGHENRRPFELSGGQQQRVALCRALVHEPELLLMDEPFGALDALTREILQKDLERIFLERQPTVVLVTHDVREAVTLADRVLVLNGPPTRIAADVRVPAERPRFAELRPEVELELDQLVHRVREQITH